MQTRRVEPWKCVFAPGGSCVAGNGQSNQACHVALPFDEATRRSLRIRHCVAAPTHGADAKVDGDPDAVLHALTPFEAFEPVARSSRLATVGSTWPR